MVKGGTFSAFAGTFPRIVSNGALTIPSRILFGMKKMPKRWYARVENKKISLFPRLSGKRRLSVVNPKSRGRIFIKALLKSAKINSFGEIVICASFHGDFIIIRAKRKHGV